MALLSMAMVIGLVTVPAVPATSATPCSPTATILPAPFGPGEVQAKAVNDRGDIVGFAPGRDSGDPHLHAVMWKRGGADGVIDLGVLRGYVSSEAYAVNNDRVVVGLLYDKKGRTFPFRWYHGYMKVLKGPDGRRHQASLAGRNSINERGQVAGTLVLAGNLRAVRWTATGKSTALPRLPGHAWSYAFGINEDGLVSGWSRKKPRPGGEENPVLWPSAGKVIALKTAPNRADGIAEATNPSGLTVGYLGNLGTPKDPEADEAVFWSSRSAKPTKLKPLARQDTVAELVDVNDNGLAAGMSGTYTDDGFPLFKPAVWRSDWKGLRPLPLPVESTQLPVVTTFLNDINEHGVIVGTVYGLTGPDPSTLQQIDPVVWRCVCGP